MKKTLTVCHSHTIEYYTTGKEQQQGNVGSAQITQGCQGV